MSSHPLTLGAHHVRRALNHALAWGDPRDAAPATGPADPGPPVDPARDPYPDRASAAAPATTGPGRAGAVRG